MIPTLAISARIVILGGHSASLVGDSSTCVRFGVERRTCFFYKLYGEGALHGAVAGMFTVGAGHVSIFMGGGSGTGL